MDIVATLATVREILITLGQLLRRVLFVRPYRGRFYPITTGLPGVSTLEPIHRSPFICLVSKVHHLSVVHIGVLFVTGRNLN